ncbi:MAG: hypothetical protein Q4D47_03260 [Erysipelotrichaceae bacterium]|nr:hypothetical protein [Erysipelotrichaceae bacterium]
MKFKTLVGLAAIASAAVYLVKKFVKVEVELKEDGEEKILHTIEETQEDEEAPHECCDGNDEACQCSCHYEEQPSFAKPEVKEEPVFHQNEAYQFEHHETYTNLDENFKSLILNQKEAYDHEYPIGSHINVYHHMKFENTNDLYHFVEDAKGDGYSCDVDEYNLTVKVTKGLYVNEGTIIHNILDVANHTKILHGEYLGYSLELI